MTLLQEEPQAGPSGSSPEEGIVIIGNNSSMHVIAPEDLPVTQDVKVEDSDIGDPDPVCSAGVMCVCLTKTFKS